MVRGVAAQLDCFGLTRAGATEPRRQRAEISQAALLGARVHDMVEQNSTSSSIFLRTLQPGTALYHHYVEHAP